jgi:hypothetical protein
LDLEEFENEGNKAIKITNLLKIKGDITNYRRVKGDGNGLYRSIGISYIKKAFNQ